jgi:hypothetical protein
MGADGLVSQTQAGRPTFPGTLPRPFPVSAKLL